MKGASSYTAAGIRSPWTSFQQQPGAALITSPMGIHIHACVSLSYTQVSFPVVELLEAEPPTEVVFALPTGGWTR